LETTDKADSTARVAPSNLLFFVAMQTLVEDAELKTLRAMAEGSKPFNVSGLWERLAALDMKEFWKLPPRERLAVGYYQTAKRRVESLKEG
jgi:hypothetical protein